MTKTAHLSVIGTVIGTVLGTAIIAASATGCTSAASGGPGSSLPPGTTGSGTISWTDNGTHYSGPVSYAMLQFPKQGGQQEAEFSAVIFVAAGTTSLKLALVATGPDPLTPGAFSCAMGTSGSPPAAMMDYEIAPDNAFVETCTVTLSHAPSQSDTAATGTFAMTANLADGSHNVTGSFDLKVLVFAST